MIKFGRTLRDKENSPSEHLWVSHVKSVSNERDIIIIFLALWAYPEKNDNQQMAEIARRYRFNQNSLLNVNQVRVFYEILCKGF